MNKGTGSQKYILIAEKIQDEIEAGIWKEGEMIPTVRVLAEKYSVSPQTANKATSHLAGLGILSSRQGSGSVVTASRPRKSAAAVPMLIDRARSAYLRGENSAMGYHGKELYLAYLNAMEEEGKTPRLLVYSKEDAEVSGEIREALVSARGVLVQGTLPDCYLNLLRERDIPAVLINREAGGACAGRIGSVLMSGRGLEQMAAYMASLGHRQILYAFSKEFEMTDIYQNRLDYFKQCISRSSRGAEPEILEFAFSPGSSKDAEALARQISGGYRAVVCFNDITALRIYDLAHQTGIRIPEDASVCGYDDMFMAEMAAPPLTTVRVNRKLLLEDSVKLLKELMAGSSPACPVRLSDTDLIIRRSCWHRL